MVERDFALDGSMKPMSHQDRQRVNGHLPFYSVDTKEEADALVALALERGEFFRKPNGDIIEVTLAHEQTLDNLRQAGENLAALHKEITAC